MFVAGWPLLHVTQRHSQGAILRSQKLLLSGVQCDVMDISPSLNASLLLEGHLGFWFNSLQNQTFDRLFKLQLSSKPILLARLLVMTHERFYLIPPRHAWKRLATAYVRSWFTARWVWVISVRGSFTPERNLARLTLWSKGPSGGHPRIITSSLVRRKLKFALRWFDLGQFKVAWHI